MKYNKKNFTYGCELEFADVCIDNELPEGCVWNKKDISLVNSNGVANDPLGITTKFGGEINTRPTNNIDDQAILCYEIIKNLNPKPIINYKCALHIHIKIPGLTENLEDLKNLLKYCYKNDLRAFEITSKIEKPEKLNKVSYKEYKRVCDSWHYKIKESVYLKVLEAKTIEEFIEFHNKSINSHGLTKRAGINFIQLKETGTIEFRHFFGTTNFVEIFACLKWCDDFITEGLTTQKTPDEILEENKKNNLNFKFPEQKKFDFKLQSIFNLTNLKKNKRKDVLKYLLNNKI